MDLIKVESGCLEGLQGVKAQNGTFAKATYDPAFWREPDVSFCSGKKFSPFCVSTWFEGMIAARLNLSKSRREKNKRDFGSMTDTPNPPVLAMRYAGTSHRWRTLKSIVHFDLDWHVP